ncbi:TolC family protein [Azorhizophilus paspali]|uniref:TolC family protein n=1 Tax=Azorhizophilus paspali TaxID=69963 RepID=A0ABV6SFQ7_AZOPA
MTRSGSGSGTYLISSTGFFTASATGGSEGVTQSSSRRVSGISDNYSAQLSLSWELDLWSKLRRTLEEDRASAAELADATLSAQSSLAQNYFQLRVLDKRIKLYDINIRSYERYLRVMRDQYEQGQTSRATLAQAETQLESARASSLNPRWQRAQYEHAIAILIGKAPAGFSLPVARFKQRIPETSNRVVPRIIFCALPVINRRPVSDAQGRGLASGTCVAPNRSNRSLSSATVFDAVLIALGLQEGMTHFTWWGFRDSLFRAGKDSADGVAVPSSGKMPA